MNVKKMTEKQRHIKIDNLTKEELEILAVKLRRKIYHVFLGMEKTKQFYYFTINITDTLIISFMGVY